MKICLVGDSIAKGVVLDGERGRYIYAKNSAVRLFERDGLEIFNLSKFGSTIDMAEKLLSGAPESLSEFDYTILEFGGNDCDFDWKSIDEKPCAEHICKTPIESFKNIYIKLIEQIKSKGGRPLILNIPPIDAKKYFKWVTKNLTASNILSFLIEVDYISRWQEMFNVSLTHISQICGIPILDIRSAFLSKPNFNDYLCEDGIHPNELGQELIYKSLKNRVAAALV